MSGRRVVIATAVATLMALGIVGADEAGVGLGPARVAAGLFVSLIAPGLALELALRPRFLDGLARFVLAVPLSFAIGAIVGVLLDPTPAGIRPVPVALALAIVTAGLLAVALWRDGSETSANELWRDRPRRRRSFGLRRRLRAVGATSSVVVAKAEAATSVATPGRLARAWSMVGTAIDHVRDPLFLNAYALGLSGVLTSGLGVVYWAVAARLYPVEIVGVNASLLSLVTLLANVSQLNLRSGFSRFVPIAGTRTETLVRVGYAAAAGLAALLGVGLVVLLLVAPDVLPGITMTPELAWLLPLTIVLWTVFTIQDHALVALRRSPWVPVENAVFAIAKILLLIPLATAATALGILISWTLPTAIGVAVVSGWILARLVPRQQRAAEATAEPEADPVTAGRVARYVGADYAGALFAIGSASILPVIVLSTVGAASSAHFYIVSLIAMATQLVPTVLCQSLLVEVSSGHATFERDARRVIRQYLVLLGPLVAVLVLFADPILSIFGASYVEGSTALRLMALAGIPYAVINLAFVRLRLDGRMRSILGAQAVLAVLTIVPAVLVLGPFGITGLGAVVLIAQTAVAAVLGIRELGPLIAGRSRTPREDEPSVAHEPALLGPPLPEGPIPEAAPAVHPGFRAADTKRRGRPTHASLMAARKARTGAGRARPRRLRRV